MFRASFEPRAAGPDLPGVLRLSADSIARDKSNVATLVRPAKGEIERDIVYINQLVCSAIIAVIGAAITVERTIAQFVRQ